MIGRALDWLARRAHAVAVVVLELRCIFAAQKWVRIGHGPSRCRTAILLQGDEPIGVAVWATSIDPLRGEPGERTSLDAASPPADVLFIIGDDLRRAELLPRRILEAIDQRREWKAKRGAA